MKKTILILGIIFLLIGISINPSASIGIKKKSIKISNQGNTLYVGGGGPNNYTKIQDAINDSLNGDTINVYSGTYPEKIIINKSINLIGENREKTIIINSTEYSEKIITVTADQVNISYFTIIGNWHWQGIYLYSSNNIIQNLNITNYNRGIILSNTSYNNFICNNYLYQNGIYLEGSCNNTVEENLVEYFSGIFLSDKSNYNIVSQNTFIYKSTGVDIKGNSDYNIIIDNFFTDIGLGSIRIWKNSKYNQVLNNTIFNCRDGQINIQESGYNNVIGNHLSNDKKGGIILHHSSSECNVSYNYVYNNSVGIRASSDSSDNTIYRNVITDINGTGLALEFTKNNSVVENTVSNCIIGMKVFNAINNEIYRNNYINNKDEIICESICENIWDDNNLGNFWEDYTGYDRNEDGIGDTPKNIKGENNSDHYPLMVPYGSNTSIRITTPLEGYFYIRNIRLKSFSSIIVFGNIKIKASAVNYMDTSVKVEKVEFYIDGRLRWVDKTAPYSWRWRLSSHLKHNHIISVVVYDSSGNTAMDEQQVWRFF